MKRIALKLWLGMMALISVVLVLLWLFQIVFLGKFYTNTRINNVKKEGQAIVKVLELGNDEEFKRKSDEFAYNNNASIELVDLNYNTIYTAGNEGSTGTMMGMHSRMGMNQGKGMMGNNNVRVNTCNQASQGKSVQVTTVHPVYGTQSELIGLPVYMFDEVIGVYLIDIPITPVQETVEILKTQLVYIIGILLIASLILSFALAKGFTKPILEITKVSEKMAEGDLTPRVKISGQDEIGRLGETINYMGEELSKIEELRKDLIANVSHELRTPLSLIRGYAETIRDVSGNNPEKREKHVNIMIEESERLSMIVDDILNLSQMQAGYVQLDKQKFDLGDMLEDVVKKYEIESSNRNIKISLETIDAIVVEADRAKIEQVLYNLINNAINHTDDGGSIGVSAKIDKNEVIIKVSDNGSGIPQDELKHIWDRFYKADKSGKRKKAGTGLGLSIVKNILVAHRVKYGVESIEGVGTTFWFTLNRAQ